MAIINNNPLVEGWSGMIGGTLVFRQVGNRMVVSAAPRPAKKRSSAQQNHHRRFKAAAAYAAAQFKQTEGRAYYEALALKHPEVNAYNLALADYFHAPQIHEVDTTAYTGKKGDRIWILATDDAGVAEVRVKLYATDGTLLEQGNALNKTAFWMYEAQQNLESYAPIVIHVEAVDRPGNTQCVTSGRHQ